MSMQWEVVGKPKKSRNPEKNISKSEQKRLIENGPKLEDIMPPHQMKSLFANLNREKKKENKSPKVNNGSNKPSSPKKVLKPASEQNKKPAPQPQLNKPKNLNAAFLALSAADLGATIENMKINFPDSQLVWLKAISSYLNTNLHFESDPVFSGKPLEYPSNAVPENVQSVIISALRDVDEVNLFYFFDQLLTSLAMEMTKGQPVVGYKILLQMIGLEWPQVCSSNLARSAILRNSYQNRNTIGLSLLWALGQGGYVDLTVGLNVWQNIMTPIIEMKSYTRFVCEYIERILEMSKNDAKISMTQDEFFATYKTLTTKYSSGLPKDCQQMLSKSALLFMRKYIQSSFKLSNLFLNLFRNIENSQSALELTGSMDCIIKSEDCFKIWKMNYKKNLLASLLLMQNISKEWSSLPNSFTKSENLSEFLNEISKINNELMQGKKRDPNLEDIISIVKNLQDKSQKKKASTKKSSSVCPWVCGSFLLLVAIAGLISYDVHLNGGIFEKSSTGKVLKSAGALPYVETAWYKTMSYSARGYKWVEEKAPVYYEKASIFSKPYLNLTCDVFKIGRNTFATLWENTKDLVSKKTPAVVDFIEQYAPGLPKKIQDLSVSAWSSSVSAYECSCDFFKTKVFVGSLSPENLCKALNQTQVVAAEYYSWFNEKVDYYAKIK